ncbi:SDR family oxidoreductase [Legionella israelensis]|uniref:SDR family oxidoreductase n=1 Tax=Legionella israelensis TaxID=454 RepID=UPI003CC81E2E
MNAISSGPIKTRAASGLADFDSLMEKAVIEAPLHQVVTIEAIGEAAAFLISPEAKYITGQVIYVDGGYNIRA